MVQLWRKRCYLSLSNAVLFVSWRRPPGHGQGILNITVFICTFSPFDLGLSPDLQSMEQIRRIMRPTDVPDQGLLCDLLWSDPDKDVLGWGENDRGVSFTFGSEVVAKFLHKHDLDLICRAHQVMTIFQPPTLTEMWLRLDWSDLINRDQFFLFYLPNTFRILGKSTCVKKNKTVSEMCFL